MVLRFIRKNKEQNQTIQFSAMSHITDILCLLGGSKSFAVRLLNIFFVNNNSTGLPDYMIINVLHILVIKKYRYSIIYIYIYIYN